MQGTAKRWEVVTAYVRTRTQEEVVDMVKHGLNSRKGQQAKSQQFSIAKKRQATPAIKSDPTGRMEACTDVDINISGTYMLPQAVLFTVSGCCCRSQALALRLSVSECLAWVCLSHSTLLPRPALAIWRLLCQQLIAC